MREEREKDRQICGNICESQVCVTKDVGQNRCGIRKIGRKENVMDASFTRLRGRDVKSEHLFVCVCG